MPVPWCNIIHGTPHFEIHSGNPAAHTEAQPCLCSVGAKQHCASHGLSTSQSHAPTLIPVLCATGQEPSLLQPHPHVQAKASASGPLRKGPLLSRQLAEHNPCKPPCHLQSHQSRLLRAFLIMTAHQSQLLNSRPASLPPLTSPPPRAPCPSPATSAMGSMTMTSARMTSPPPS